MQSLIIDTFLDGNNPGEEIRVSENCVNLMSEFQSKVERLGAELTQSQKEILDDIYKLYGNIETEVTETYFEYGFKLGVKLGKEIFG